MNQTIQIYSFDAQLRLTDDGLSDTHSLIMNAFSLLLSWPLIIIGDSAINHNDAQTHTHINQSINQSIKASSGKTLNSGIKT